MSLIKLKTFSRFLLAGLQVFVSLTALIGGAKLVSDPSGNAIGIPLEWLHASPFPDYSIPGWTLLIVIGFGNGAASLLSALGHRQFGRLAIVQGGLLAGYIAVEVWAVGLRVMLQPLYFMFGLAQIFLGIVIPRKPEVRCEGVIDLSEPPSPECASEPRR
jgi:hypothetical protein